MHHLNDPEASLEGKFIGMSPILEIWTRKVQTGDLSVPCRESCQERVSIRKANEWLVVVAAVLTDPCLLLAGCSQHRSEMH